MRHISIPFLIFFVFFSMNIIGQSSSIESCIGSLKYDALTEIVEKKHYVFTGSDTTGLNVKSTKITLIEAREEWVKRTDKNCVAPNPKECIKLVLEQLPPVTMNMYTLDGPDVTDQYEVRIEKVKVATQKSGVKELPVVCQTNRTPKLISKLQEALVSFKYPVEVTGIWDEATSLAMSDFQKSKGMPYGDLSLETLAALGIY